MNFENTYLGGIPSDLFNLATKYNEPRIEVENVDNYHVSIRIFTENLSAFITVHLTYIKKYKDTIQAIIHAINYNSDVTLYCDVDRDAHFMWKDRRLVFIQHTVVRIENGLLPKMVKVLEDLLKM